MATHKKSRTRASRERPATREESKQATRQALIAAGISLIAEQGLDGPSLDAICERAGYTRGAFYVHFRDRDDFIVAAMDTIGVGFLEAIFTGGVQTTVMRFLEAFASGQYPIGGPGGVVRPHQLLEACARSPIIRERYVGLIRASIEGVASMARSDQSAGSLRGDVEPRLIAETMVALAIGLHTVRDLDAPFDAAGIARMLERALAARS